MIIHPRHGQQVQVWYNRRAAPYMPLHAKIGEVVVISKGPGPRNHGVRIGGQVYGVPCGNLRKP